MCTVLTPRYGSTKVTITKDLHVRHLSLRIYTRVCSQNYSASITIVRIPHVRSKNGFCEMTWTVQLIFHNKIDAKINKMSEMSG
jgi:hypothetical protein